MKVSKIRDVKTPERGTEKSAGIDFFVPIMNEKFINDFKELNGSGFCLATIDVYRKIHLSPQQKVLIPSGIKVNFEGEPKALIGFNKSSIGAKKGLDLLACVVDQDYQSEILISLVNTGNSNVWIDEGAKLTQFILVPVFYDNIEEVAESDLYESKTKRGEGGFGSTGN
jgi:deoxyuridine 5'-triphosphate nucleotidohydrolase